MLTDKKIKALEARSKPYKVGDSGGLYLHIKPTGKHVWRFKYRFNGKEKLLTIGVYGVELHPKVIH